MEEAASYVAPSHAELERLSGADGRRRGPDDPIHPLEVALEWVSAAPHAALRTVTLDEFGADPSVLGAACVAALTEAAARAVR